eukprot:5561068-Prymnesium_polylepis.1
MSPKPHPPNLRRRRHPSPRPELGAHHRRASPPTTSTASRSHCRRRTAATATRPPWALPCTPRPRRDVTPQASLAMGFSSVKARMHLPLPLLM